MSGCALLKSATRPSITLARPPPTSTGYQKLSRTGSAAVAAEAQTSVASPTHTARARRRFMIFLPGQLSFQPGVHMTADEVALGQEEHDQHRGRNEQRGGHEQVPVGRHFL